MAKHDMEMHLVRPDFVGRTSVLQAIPGYSPVENAMDVAQRFVSLPYYVPGSTFAGPFGADVKMSLRDRFKMAWYRLRLRFAAKRANKIAARVAALPAPQAPTPAVPPVTSQGLAPAATGKEQAALMLTAGMASSGDEIMPPGVIRPEIVAGTQLRWDFAAQAPMDFATYAMKYGPARITEPFAARAWNQFLIQRSRGNRG